MGILTLLEIRQFGILTFGHLGIRTLGHSCAWSFRDSNIRAQLLRMPVFFTSFPWQSVVPLPWSVNSSHPHAVLPDADTVGAGAGQGAVGAVGP